MKLKLKHLGDLKKSPNVYFLNLHNWNQCITLINILLSVTYSQKTFDSLSKTVLTNLILIFFLFTGRWQPPYEPHTAPWEWSGSVAILEKYMEGQGRQPVKYGQCWVFSAVTTTSTINIKTSGGQLSNFGVSK